MNDEQKFLRHPDAIAWDEWKSGIGAGACEPATIGSDSSHRQYLENRLNHAFQAGIKHGREQAAKDLAAMLTSELTK